MKRQSRFYCDSAVITTFDDTGHTLINFAQKGSHHSQLLGFAGFIDSHDGRTMRVNTVYLKAGEAITVSDGLCQKFFDGQRLSGLMCAMKVDEVGRRTTAVVTFDVAPGQSHLFEDHPAPPTSKNTTAPPADAKAETIPDGGKLEILPNGIRVTTLPNGNKLEQLPDGTSWAVLHPNNEFLAVRVDQPMSTSSLFATDVIVNLPESDVVNAPLSERIQVEGDCPSMTYSILGIIPYEGKNGSGLPDADSATGWEQVLRRVMPNTLMSHVFDLVCKRP